jgi:hypothetical protein
VADADESRSAAATRLDEETFDYLRAAVGREHGLSEAQGRRLVGATLGGLRGNASGGGDTVAKLG